MLADVERFSPFLSRHIPFIPSLRNELCVPDYINALIHRRLLQTMSFSVSPRWRDVVRTRSTLHFVDVQQTFEKIILSEANTLP